MGKHDSATTIWFALKLRLLLAGLVMLRLVQPAANAAAGATYDLVVYGGTSAGVVAAVQARRMGKSVVVIEPTQRLG